MLLPLIKINLTWVGLRHMYWDWIVDWNFDGIVDDLKKKKTFLFLKMVTVKRTFTNNYTFSTG